MKETFLSEGYKTKFYNVPQRIPVSNGLVYLCYVMSGMFFMKTTGF